MAMSGGRDVMSRAERFEDEKRRIIDSCFNKKDEDGSILETYITHLKITEFSSYPTSPPPPQARTPQSEKPRVIIVAVRKSGRVRMHKSKENPNGTFSIGKTWNLDDLTAVESFTGQNVPPDFRQWAGDVGFIVTLGKPYYWQAQTDKEKKFFIASLVKIYGKYTGGRVPSLSNFDQRELDQVLGGASRRGAVPPPQPSPLPQQQSTLAPARPAVPGSFPSESGVSVLSGASSYSATPTAQTEFRPPSRSPLPPTGSSSPSASIDSSRTRENSAALRRLAGSNKSQDSVANSYRSEDASSLRPRSRGQPNGASTPSTITEPLPAPEERPPERKRPPMDPARPQGFPDDNLVPAPLISPGMRREPVAPPPRSTERMSPRKPSLRSQRSEVPSIEDVSAKAVDEPVDGGPVGKVPSNGLSTASTATASAPQTPIEPPPEPEDLRPGLGPMIKAKKSKGDIAGAFWKAAAAASAFKPRPGGAAEKLRLAQNKSADGPDGITAVVPAPPRPISVEAPKADPPPRAAERTSGIPEVKVTVPNSSRPTSLQAAAKAVQKTVEKPVEKPAEPEVKEEARRSIVVGNDVKYLATLGIDPTIMDNRSVEFTKYLDYFGFVPGDKMRLLSYDDLKVDIDREVNKAQAGGWLARFREEDERVDAIKTGIDTTIAECEELDNLLTLYSVELSTLADDIAYIEAQGQGLQVQAANQKLLKKELESLLDTCAITIDDLQALRTAPMDSVAGIEEIEASLVTLYTAMMKIDPSMGAGETRKSADATSDQALDFNSDFGKMRIVQEKKEMYLSESSAFIQRLVDFMARQFDDAYRETKRALDSALAKKVDARHHDAGRDLLWKYGPLMLYARDTDLETWNRILQVYQEKSNPLYKSEFREVLESWKRNARKVTGEEKELLFTTEQEKKEEGIATTARKLTVKRSQTLAKAIRSPLSESRMNVDKTSDSRSMPYEVFAGVLDDLIPLVEMEQNFIVDFFHATTLDQTDFPESVAAVRPRNRRGGDLKRHRLMEPDRDLARRVTRSMEFIFAFVETDWLAFMTWVVKDDPLQGIGVLATLERKMSNITQSNQDYLNNVLQKLHGNLEIMFKKFVDEQIRAIEETKVKIKKRKGVISFMRVFPLFLTAVENMLGGMETNSNVRRTVDHEYDRILKSMFDSLMVIARENPAVTVAAAGSADPEDKEALNFHILLIENMNHYLEEVGNVGEIEVLDDWRETATSQFNEHMGLYLNAVMRRPLGRLLEHLENIEAQLAAGKSAGAVAAQPSNSKATFNKVLGGYDSREVRKGIEALRKRVEKHFGDADDPTLSRGLVNRVLRECERFYGDVELRISSVTTNVYGGDVLFEWPRSDVKSAFSNIGR